jgi:hypothetical protein
MSEHRELGERLVAAAAPKFKDFRVDFEKISNNASKFSGGELSNEQAAAMYLDQHWDLRIPLQRRYMDAGAADAVAHYHTKEFKLVQGRNSPWPDEPARDALRLFAQHGRPELGVALIRTYAEMQHKRLKRDYSSRNPRGSRKPRDEDVQRTIAVISQILADKIPDRKAELLRDLEAVTPYIEQHGTDEDRAWFDDLRREIWMEKRA